MDGATLMTSPWCVAASNPETRETPRMSTHPGLRETTCARNRGSRALRGRAAQMSLPNGRARQTLRRQKRLVRGWSEAGRLPHCWTDGYMYYIVTIIYYHNIITIRNYAPCLWAARRRAPRGAARAPGARVEPVRAPRRAGPRGAGAALRARWRKLNPLVRLRARACAFHIHTITDVQL